MKKKPELGAEDELEILKAVAQTWHSRSGSWHLTSEFEAHHRSFRGNKPSRFKLEAMRLRAAKFGGGACWDFRHSLCDSYEIVTLAKKLEVGLGLEDDPFGVLGAPAGAGRVHRRRKLESIKSLRNLFNRSSSRRFGEPA